MPLVQDRLHQELQIGDYVVFYSEIYQVTALGNSKHDAQTDGHYGQIKLKLLNGGYTNRPVSKHSRQCIKLSTEAVECIQAIEQQAMAEFLEQLNGRMRAIIS